MTCGFMINDKPKKKNMAKITELKQDKEIDTVDIYNDDQRNEMLRNDEITAAESAFMEGSEMTKKEMKKNKKSLHKDSVSVELAQEEYNED